jgi:hypothetical protein
MTYIAYCNAETGFRHFTHIYGVDVSYDRRFIEHVIRERAAQATAMKNHHQFTEAQLAEAKAQIGSMPPQLDAIMEHNRKIIIDQMTYAKRLTTAEAALNGELVRDVMMFENIEDAVAYTAGPKPKETSDLPQPQ